jgi:hypothetical protein
LLKNLGSIIPPKCVVASTIVEVGISVAPLASLELSTTSEKISVLEVTLGSVGHDSSATTKSTSIFPPSLCSSFPCVMDSNANLEWVCTLLELKGNIRILVRIRVGKKFQSKYELLMGIKYFVDIKR